VLWTSQGGTHRVAWMCEGARRLAICPGMLLSEATALTGSRKLSAEPWDKQADDKALEELGRWCHQFTPSVALDTEKPGDCLLLDITQSAAVFGAEERVAQLLLAQLAAKRILAQGAIAETPGAAWAVAHFAPQFSRVPSSSQVPPSHTPVAPLPPQRNQPSKKTSRSSPPADELSEPTTPPRYRREHPEDSSRSSQGVFPCEPLLIVPSGHAVEALQPLPPEALRVDEVATGWLRELGITTVGQLMKIPPEELIQRFGPGILHRWKQAIGEVQEVLHFLPEAEDLTGQWDFEYPTSLRAEIATAFAEILKQLIHRLSTRGYGILGLRGFIRGEKRMLNSFEVGLFRPCVKWVHLKGILEARLEGISLPEPVYLVELQVTQTAPLSQDQGSLFEGLGTRCSPAKWAELFDRLCSRLGPQAVLQVELTEELLPEYSYCLVPGALGSRNPGVQGSQKRDSAIRGANPGSKERKPRSKRGEADWGFRKHSGGAPCDWPPRPIRLFSPPVAIAAIALGAEGPPAQFVVSGRRYPVLRSWGPERLETGWWRGHLIRRDYYRVETASGEQFWVFRSLDTGQWFLHGSFD